MKYFLPFLFLFFFMIENYSAQSDERRKFEIVEDLPVYPGCENLDSQEEKNNCTNKKIYLFIKKNIRYPIELKNNKVNATIYVRYVLNENGLVDTAEVLKSTFPNESLSLRAINTIKSLPKMTPAKQHGKPVKVQYTVPVKFDSDKTKLAED